MISDVLKSDIERYAETMRAENALLAKARRGEVGPDAVAAYLNNVMYLVQHTPVCLERAERRARELGDFALASYFAHKVGEEIGHDRWAQNDVRQLQDRFEVRPIAEFAPAMVELVDYLIELVEQAPTLYLAYILFAEYVTVLLGPEWLTALERRCGIPPTAMTVVSRHAELDREHTAEGLREIDTLVTTEAELERLRETLRHSMAYFSRFTEEICQLAS